MRGLRADAQCPAHDDQHESLSVKWEAGKTLVQCHRAGGAKAGGCPWEDILAALGLPRNALYDNPIEADRQQSSTPARRSRSASTSRPAPARKKKSGPRWKFVDTYPYTDEAGELLGQVLRTEDKQFPWKKVDGRGRLVWGAPARRPLWMLPEVIEAVRSGRTIYLPEGEKDAKNVRAEGEPATTIPGGALALLNEPEQWAAEYAPPLAGADVVICLDWDPAEKKDYAGQRHGLMVYDRLAGVAVSVRLVRAHTGKDVSDHLEAGHCLADLVPVDVAELRAMIDAHDQAKATEAAAESSVESSAAPAPAETPRTAGRRRKGLAPVYNLPPRSDGEDDNVNNGGGPGGGNGGGEPPEADVIPIERTEYAVIDDRLVMIDRSRGKERRRELMNVDARLARRIRTDKGDGSRVTVTHVDLVAARDGQRVELPDVPIEDFDKLTWPADLCWPDVEYRRTQQGRSDVVNGILHVSGSNVPTVTAYGSMGWRTLETGGGVYVHAGGAIDANGAIDGTRVNVSSVLHCYALPAPPELTDTGTVRAALDASLSMLRKIPPHISAPLLGAAYRALLGESSTTVEVLGDSGVGKTALAALALQHYAPSIRHDTMPIPAGEDGATLTATEEWRYEAGHSLFVADDLAPDRGAERSGTRANLLARSQHNRIGKGRGKKDGGTRPVHKPRGLLMITGETGATAPSAENRMLYVPVKAGEVPLDTLIELSTRELADLRGTLTAARAQWHAPTWETLADWIGETRARYAAAFTTGTTSTRETSPEARRADLAADLATGFRAVLDMATATGAYTASEAAEVWELAWEGLAACKAAQGVVTARRTMPERSADLLRSAILSGRAHVAGHEGGAPVDARAWGWETAPLDYRPAGERVGWTDGQMLWLNPGVAFAQIERQGRAESDPLNVTSRALSGSLASAGLLTVQQKKNQRAFSVGRTIEGRQEWVWELPVSWLFPDDGPDRDGTTPDDTPPPPALPEEPPTWPATADDRPDQPILPDVDQAAPTPATDDSSKTTTSTAPDVGTEPARPDTVEPPSSPPERRQSPAPAEIKTASRFAAPAVVVDATGACLPDGRFFEVPDLHNLADLLAWAETQRLGTARRHGPAEDGQVWIMPGLAAKLGLPEHAPKEGKPSTSHKALTPVTAAGWKIGRNGLRGWTRVYRPGGRTLLLVIVGWESPSSCPMLDGDPDMGALAMRLGLYTHQVGIPFRIHQGITGLDLVDALRPPGREMYLEAPAGKPEPLKGRGQRQPEEDYTWQRPPSVDEQNLKYVHAYDLNGMYLSASGAAHLGLCDAEHVTDHPGFDPTLPGYWLLDLPDWNHARLPSFFDPGSRGRSGPCWLTTPTLAYAAESLGYDIQPIEAYVYRHHGRYLEPWYKVLRDARTALTPEIHDPDARATLAAIKATYAAAIGRLDMSAREGERLYRPDWRHLIVSTARVNFTRKLAKVAEECHRYPLLVHTDCALYASDDPDPETACPAPIKLGTGLGQAKIEGTALLADIAPALGKGARHTEKTLELIKGQEG